MLCGLIAFSTERPLLQKKLSQELQEVLNDVVKCVNFTRARPLNQRLFSSLCTDMDSDYQVLLLHTEVRWLPRGCVLKWVCGLREEIAIFLKQQNYVGLAEKFLQVDFKATVAYLADIFYSLNSLNLSMQGNCFTVIDQNLCLPQKTHTLEKLCH